MRQRGLKVSNQNCLMNAMTKARWNSKTPSNNIRKSFMHFIEFRFKVNNWMLGIRWMSHLKLKIRPNKREHNQFTELDCKIDSNSQRWFQRLLSLSTTFMRSRKTSYDSKFYYWRCLKTWTFWQMPNCYWLHSSHLWRS